jgi:hypothetical protein
MADSPHGPGGGPGSSYQQPPHPPPYPPPKEGMPTFLKVLIGCGVALLVVVIAVVVFAFFGYRFISEQIGGFEEQAQATETFERLAQQYPFTPPADGVVTENQVQTFLTVADEVWVEVAAFAEELNRLGDETSEGEEEPGLGDVVSGMGAFGKLFRARLLLAEALERHRLSNAEFVWTGTTLLEAYDAVTDPKADVGEVPGANLELARRYQSQLAEYEEEEDEIGKRTVIIMISAFETTEELLEAMEEESTSVGKK